GRMLYFDTPAVMRVPLGDASPGAQPDQRVFTFTQTNQGAAYAIDWSNPDAGKLIYTTTNQPLTGDAFPHFQVNKLFAAPEIDTDTVDGADSHVQFAPDGQSAEIHVQVRVPDVDHTVVTLYYQRSDQPAGSRTPIASFSTSDPHMIPQGY